MKIVVCGPSGAGKTTLTKALAMVNENHTVLVIDDFVNRLYATNPDVSEYINRCIGIGSHLSDWKNHILGDMYDRHKFETYLWLFHIKPVIDIHDNIIVDGLLPKCVEEYVGWDQVIYVTAPECVRSDRLKQRGVSVERIDQIMGIQKDFGNIDKYFL